MALYVQDTITMKNLSLNLGIRGDLYYGLSKPRKRSRGWGSPTTSSRPTRSSVSYARTLETPFNENLVLASLGCDDAVVATIRCISKLLKATGALTAPASDSRYRNEFHAGLQQAFGKYLVVDGEYIWKYTHRAYDFSVLGNTPVTFPIEWDNSKIPGFADPRQRSELPRLTAFVVMSSVAARSSHRRSAESARAHPSEINAVPHRPRREFQPNHAPAIPALEEGPWSGSTGAMTADSSPAPCLAPEAIATMARMGPTRWWMRLSSRPTSSFRLGSSARQRLGLATPTTPVTPIPFVLRRTTVRRLEDTAPGTEDDDRNPPRVNPATCSIAIGHDNFFDGDRYKWSLVTAINVANKDTVYNFLSTFSGTHYVTPRSLTAEIGFHF